MMETAIETSSFTLVSQVVMKRTPIRPLRPNGESKVIPFQQPDGDTQVVDKLISNIPDVHTWSEEIKMEVAYRTIGLILEEMPKVINSTPTDEDSKKHLEETVAWVLDFRPPNRDFPIPFFYACLMFSVTRDGIKEIQQAVRLRHPEIAKRYSSDFVLQ